MTPGRRIRLAVNPASTASPWWTSGGAALWSELQDVAGVLEVQPGELEVDEAFALAFLARARELPGWTWPDPPVLAVEDVGEGAPYPDRPDAWWAPPRERS